MSLLVTLNTGPTSSTVADVASLSNKAVPVKADRLVIGDSAASNATKYIDAAALSKVMTRYNVCDPAFGATGDGSTDDTTAIQACFDAINTLGGGIAYFPKGTYVITAKLSVPRGVCIEGAMGYSATGGSASERPPELAWNGSAGVDMLEFTTIAGSRHFRFIRNFFIRKKSGASNVARHGIVLPDRVDSFFQLDNVQISNLSGNAIQFNNGGINTQLRNVRFDNIVDYAIKWTLDNPDQLSLDNVTWDNVGNAGSGGLLYVDGSPADANEFLQLDVRNIKAEVNTELVSGGAVFYFNMPTTTPIDHLIRANFTNVWQATAGGLTNKLGVKFSPAYDLADLHFTQCTLEVSGIPSFVGSQTGTKFVRSETHIYPHGSTWTSLGTHGSAEKAPALEIVGDMNLIGGRLYLTGKAGGLPIMANPTAAEFSAPLTVKPGQMFFYDASASSPYAVSTSTTTLTWKVITAAGTLGTLSGVTLAADWTNGQSTLTVNDASALRVDDQITVGAQSKRIININYSTNVVTTSSANSGSTETSGTAMSYTAPSMKGWTQAIS